MSAYNEVRRKVFTLMNEEVRQNEPPRLVQTSSGSQAKKITE
jgi:hypothetical protein